MKCGHCQKQLEEDPLVCGNCNVVAYCGDECASVHWVQIHANQEEKLHELKQIDKENPMDLIIVKDSNDARIYLGSLAALDTKELNHIDSVLSVLDMKESMGRFAEDWIRQRVNRGRDRNNQRFHALIDIHDSEDADISPYFDASSTWIHDQVVSGRHTLVHCVAGHSRSATLLINYMMQYEGYRTVKDALSTIQKKRPTAQPNDAFMLQLEKEEKKKR